MDRLLRKARSKGDANRPRSLPRHQIRHHSEARKCVNRIALHRGARVISRRAIAQGMSECFRSPVCSCAPNAQFLAHETAGAARTRHSLRPLFRRGATKLEKLGQIMSRDRERTLSPHVVPAKAGTHTPRRKLLENG